MAGNSKIIYKIEGPAENDRHLDLSVLSAKFAQFHKFLAESAKELGADGAAFRVVDLSHSSPVAIACAPTGTKKSSADVVRGIQENYAAVCAGETDHLSNRVLTAFEELAKSSPKKIAWGEIQLVAGGKKTTICKLDRRFRARLEEARNLEVHAINTVDGKLEHINIHGKNNQFKIYDLGHAISCYFSKDLLSSVQGALGRHVVVSGECVYRPQVAFPYKLNVQKIRKLPKAGKLPSLSDLRGIAPNATGGKSSEDFVRELRDEWD